MNKVPKVSVLIPLYNSAPFLVETLNSFLQQTFQDFELILLDDASCDDTEKLIRQVKDPRISYYKNEKNLGISASRNKLMDLAKGEYLAISDHDDRSHPLRLEKQVHFLDEHPDVSVVGCATELFCSTKGKNFWQKLKNAFINLGWVWVHPDFPSLEDAWHGCPVMHSSAMIRKADFERFHLRYNPDYSPAEDYGLWTEALLHGLKLANLREVLFFYNLHGNNFSLVRKDAMRIADQKVKEVIRQNLGLNDAKRYPYWKVILHKLRLKWLLR